MVLVFSPFGIFITNCFSRNYRAIPLPVQPPRRRGGEQSAWLAGGCPGEVGRSPSSAAYLPSATLWGAASDQIARRPAEPPRTCSNPKSATGLRVLCPLHRGFSPN